MPESLGARLRHCREQQGIALQTIAERTKIKASLLDGLERDDLRRWPGGIFRRAYFRSYVEAIGLDGDDTLREFLAVHPDPHEATERGPEGGAANDAGSPGHAPPTRIGMMLGRVMRKVLPSRSRPDVRQPAGDEAPPPSVSRSAPPVYDVAEASELVVSAPLEPDLEALAHLCTRFGCADEADDVQPLLLQAGTLLGANGLIVWIWDEAAGHLRPEMAHGYSPQVLRRLPPVPPDASNATASAFRSKSVIAVSDQTHGALVIPLIAPDGCAGVLALELPRGTEQQPKVRAVATIVASLLVLRSGTQLSEGSAAPAAGAARTRRQRPAGHRRRMAASRARA